MRFLDWLDRMAANRIPWTGPWLLTRLCPPKLAQADSLQSNERKMPSKLLEKYEMDADRRRARKAYLGISEQDERALARVQHQFAEFAPKLAEGFYRHLLAHAETARFLQDPELLERLKQEQMGYFSELLGGVYDDAYFERRLRVGEAHNVVGLAPTWYLGAFNQYLQLMLPFVAEQTGGKTTPEVLALLKVIFLDIGLALETYFAEAMDRLRQRNHELEQALQMYWQAELKAKQYAKLAGHEIRGSLNAIAAACETAAEDLEDNPQDVGELLESAHARCLKTARVVDSILSEPDYAGQPRWVDARELIREVVSRMDLYSVQRKVEFTLPEQPVRVWADPIGLREVFANLISNAAQNLDKDPGNISVVYRHEGDEQVFCVADNGPGIPKHLHDRVFQPFVRGSKGSAHQGKGLGLHFVCAIVAQHGGRVWVESVPGDGSRFYFSLPSEPAPQHAPSRQDVVGNA